jgi:CheY-like chemotaxis protein
MSTRTVLIIDSDESALRQARQVLTEAGYRVLTRSRAPGSVAAILHEKPDLVLMELNLPGVSGSSIADMLWRAAPNSELVLVAYSKLAEDQLKHKARAMGAQGFIPKGLSALELTRRVNGFIRQGESSGKLRIVSARSPSGTMPAVDTELGADALDPLSARPIRHTSGVHAAPVNVLFVDDDVASLTEYRRHLPLDEVRAEFVMSGQVALGRLLSDSPPDVVVCELMLRGVNGVDIYRRALSLDATWRHRFVFVSAPLTPVMSARIVPELQSPVLEKPVDPQRLREAVRYAVTGARIFKQGMNS